MHKDHISSCNYGTLAEPLTLRTWLVPIRQKIRVGRIPTYRRPMCLFPIAKMELHHAHLRTKKYLRRSSYTVTQHTTQCIARDLMESKPMALMDT